MSDPILRYVIFPVLDGVTSCLRHYQLQRHLQWNQSELQKYQAKQLRRLISHAYSTVPFYRRCYKAANLFPSHINTIEDLPKANIVTKAQLRNNFPHGSVSTSVPSLRMRPSRTSGSTGEIFDFYDDKRIRGHVIASRLLFESWMGLKIGDETARLTMWNLTRWRHRFMGEISIPASRWEPDAHETVKLLRSIRPESLFAAVTILSALASRILREGIDAKLALRGITTTAESLITDHRALIARAFDCPVFDRYGLAELTGYVAQECETHEGLHVNGTLALAEVIKDEEVCGPGETGRLILTNLHNYAMPFIRYDTGDLATVGDECSCGRSFQLLERIEGRSPSWVLTQTAPVSWSPFLGALLSMSIGTIQQFQFVQTKIGELTLLIAPRSALNSQQMHQLTKRLSSVHPLVKIDVETTDLIEPTVNGKRILFKPLHLESNA